MKSTTSRNKTAKLLKFIRANKFFACKASNKQWTYTKGSFLWMCVVRNLRRARVYIDCKSKHTQYTLDLRVHDFHIRKEDLLEYLQETPDGCRIVFNNCEDSDGFGYIELVAEQEAKEDDREYLQRIKLFAEQVEELLVCDKVKHKSKDQDVEDYIQRLEDKVHDLELKLRYYKTLNLE